jgi:hypothetical protein
MRPLTEQELDEMDKRFQYELSKLAEWGWTVATEQVPDPYNAGKTYETEVWTSPRTGHKVTALHGDHYTAAVSEKINEAGWKHILELNRVGDLVFKGKIREVERWGRYQSPKTGIIYTFLEAQAILENGWNEEGFQVCEHIRVLNELVGPGFTGDTVRIWFWIDHKSRGGNDDHCYALWEEKDGEVVKTKTIRTPDKPKPGNVVSWGPSGLEYSNIVTTPDKGREGAK